MLPSPGHPSATDPVIQHRLHVSPGHHRKKWLIFYSTTVSLRVKTLPRLSIDFSFTDQIWIPSRKKPNFSVTLSIPKTMDLDLGLKLIWTQPLENPSALRFWCHHQIKIPDLVKGPLHSSSADLTTMFITEVNRITKMVHLVIIPLSSRCYADVVAPEVTLTEQL